MSHHDTPRPPYGEDAATMPGESSPDPRPYRQPAPAAGSWWDPSSAPRRAGRRMTFVIAVVLTVCAAVAATLAWFVSRGESEATLEVAKRECAANTADVRLGDDGRSMVIARVAAEEDPGASLIALTCILNRVDVPDAVMSHISSTRALDGRQQASWDGFAASWTYHPDDGLNIILQEAKD